MKFQVQCECGHKWLVAQGDAGLSLSCACGRKTTVPSLSELRQQAGLSAVPLSIAELIRQRVASGEALANTRCVNCATQTKQVIRLTAQCEWAYNVFEQTSVNGIVVSERHVGERGRSVAVPVPIRLCESCELSVFHTPLPYEVLTIALRVFAAAATITCVVGFFFLRRAILVLVVAVLAALCVGLWAGRRWLSVREQNRLKRVLRQVPLYKPLLDEYPEAVIFLTEGSESE